MYTNIYIYIYGNSNPAPIPKYFKAFQTKAEIKDIGNQLRHSNSIYSSLSLSTISLVLSLSLFLSFSLPHSPSLSFSLSQFEVVRTKSTQTRKRLCCSLVAKRKSSLSTDQDVKRLMFCARRGVFAVTSPTDLTHFL